MSKNKQSFIDDLLLKGILLDEASITDLDISPCLANPDRLKHMAKIQRNLKDVLPTMFLSLPNSRLTKSPRILSFTQQQHNFMIGENGDLAVTYALDEAAVHYINDKIIELINKAIKYNITNQINLDSLVEKKKKLNPMKLYELFPKSDCRECGEETCFNYVAKILSGEHGFDQCPSTEPNKIRGLVAPVNLRWTIDLK